MNVRPVSYIRYTQGDSGENVSILGSDSIGQREKKKLV
jgi:hypothetical protein